MASDLGRPTVGATPRGANMLRPFNRLRTAGARWGPTRTTIRGRGCSPTIYPLVAAGQSRTHSAKIPRALAISHLVLCRRRLSRWLLLLLRGTGRRLLLCTLILLHHGGDLVLDLRRGHPARVPPSGAHRPHLGGATFRHHLGRQGRGLGRGRDGDPARGAGNGC